MFIYKITNIITGQYYIGQTIRSLETRFYYHVLRSNNGSKTKLHNAIRKYGSENFIIEPILSNVLKENLNKEEIRLISELSPYYNMTFGGEGGNTSNSPNYKSNHKKNCLRGKNHPRYGLSKELSPVFGSKRSQESKTKMSKTHKEIRTIRRKTCEFCKKDVDLPNYSRWHGENCKVKVKNP